MRFAVHTGIAAYPQHTCSFENTNPETLIAKPNYKVLGADALRMRLRRLCEKKASGKMWVDQQTFDDYKSGGERREWLELALCESLKKFGTGRDQYKKVKDKSFQKHICSCQFGQFFLHAKTAHLWHLVALCRQSSSPELWWSESACLRKSKR
jgi:hypothetical protein